MKFKDTCKQITAIFFQTSFFEKKKSGKRFQVSVKQPLVIVVLEAVPQFI